MHEPGLTIVLGRVEKWLNRETQLSILFHVSPLKTAQFREWNIYRASSISVPCNYRAVDLGKELH